MEFFNFFQGEFDLLYHGQTTVAAEGEQIFRARDVYSHDFLPGHLNNIKKQIKKVSKSNQNKTMIDKWEVIDMKFLPHGKILDEDLKLLKSKINELEKKLPEKFEINMKETVLLIFLASPTEKQRWSCVATKASISKRSLDIIHGDQNLRRTRSKKKK